MNSQKGFTLLEMLLSVAIIGVMAAISIPVYQSFQVRNDTNVASINIAQSLRRAQTLSQAVEGDSTWGVKIQVNNIILFKGASFALRDVAYDESFDLPTTITPSGNTEILFSKLIGLPNKNGTITLTNTVNETKTVSINTKGMVEY